MLWLLGVAAATDCAGLVTEKEAAVCNQQSCTGGEVADCVWGSWSEWTECTCEGSQSRARSVKHPASVGGQLCAGPEAEVRSCSAEDCAQNACVLAEWSSWGYCDAACGAGQQARTRGIAQPGKGGARGCSGALKELKSCQLSVCKGGSNAPLDCAWADWGDWGLCSATCEGGTQERSRSVAFPPRGGGSLCEALPGKEVRACPDTEGVQCVLERQDCEFGDWGDWGDCTTTCGFGKKLRQRDILKAVRGKPCVGRLTDVESCARDPCVVPQDCVLADWTDWSICSSDCNGHRTRSRTVEQKAVGDGKPCDGALSAVIPCALPGAGGTACGVEPKDCILDDWADWGACSTTCGAGDKVRFRSIAQMAILGEPCMGELAQVEQCDNEDCIAEATGLPCEYGPWSGWSECKAATTGACGEKHRKRDVASPPGVSKTCELADLEEVRPCTTSFGSAECHHMCDWSSWGIWTACSQECDGGQRERSRHAHVVSENTGWDCDGSEKQTQVAGCNENACLADTVRKCTWGMWSSWSECGCPGLMERKRVILIQGDPQAPCVGESDQVATCDPSLTCNAAALSQDCEWGDWTAWSSCDCKTETRARVRVVAKGVTCAGESRQVDGCGRLGDALDCIKPVDCAWGTWSDWGKCSKDCGGGQARRWRTLVQEPLHGGICEPEASAEVRPCNTEACPHAGEDCEWEDWSDWGKCSSTCDGGLQTRWRDIAHHAYEDKAIPCSGIYTEFRDCATDRCEGHRDCTFGDWEDWGECSMPCKGHAVRSRPLQAAVEGLGCQGETVQAHGCNPGLCDGAALDCLFSDWSDWSTCSAECGGGQRQRGREVAREAVGTGAPCTGPLEELVVCHLLSCPAATDCAFGEWTAWSTCSESCGGGQQTRHRDVVQEASAGGAPCVGPMSQNWACNAHSCSTEDECVWQDWSDWSTCPITCGGGSVLRTRSLGWSGADEAPSWCHGDMKDEKACSEESCEYVTSPVDCTWADWTDWGECTCAKLATRSRKIEVEASGSPSKGDPCVGPATQTTPCELEETSFKHCGIEKAQDCVFADWSDWTKCDSTCERHRHRFISASARGVGAVGCIGPLSALEGCAGEGCGKATDCVLSDWSDWGECDAECGEGSQKRSRKIETPPESSPCPSAALAELRACSRGDCESGGANLGIDCEFSVWSKWTECTRPCGGGVQFRDRSLRPGTEHGAGCDGELTMLRKCNEAPCEMKDCEFADWSPWSECNQECNGHRKRERHILHGLGASCAGPIEVTESCNLDSPTCPSEAQLCTWGDWTDWGYCSQTCGYAHRARTREPTGACDGPVVVWRLCELADCEVYQAPAVDCELSDWSDWGTCHARFAHQQVRARHAREGSNLGAACPSADLAQTRACDEGEALTCVLGDWQPWAECDAACAGGQKTRARATGWVPATSAKFEPIAAVEVGQPLEGVSSWVQVATMFPMGALLAVAMALRWKDNTWCRVANSARRVTLLDPGDPTNIWLAEQQRLRTPPPPPPQPPQRAA